MIGKIIEKKQIAQGTLRIVFQVTQPINFKPGQYMFITLTKLSYPDDRGGRRQFSIVNSPNKSNILTMTTRLSDSGFKKTLNELSIGSEVEIGPLAGVFTLPEDQNKPLVFIAGGIGITPFMSMLSYVKETKKPYHLTLIYSNRNRESTAYFQEIQLLANQIPNFKLILTMTDDPNWTGENRKIDANFIKEYFPNLNDNLYMVVGPPVMVDAVEKSLIEAGVKDENIKKENFTGY